MTNRHPVAGRARIALLALSVAAFGCGGSQADEPAHAESDPGDDPHAAHGHGGAHHGHHAGGHHHSSPAELRPLMNDLRGWLQDLQTALAAEDLAAAQTSAQAIASACDDAELGELDPDAFGPRFLEIDRELHGSAQALAERAEAGDLEGARAGYAPVASACVSCHAQAPTASAVDLGPLAP